MTAYTYTYDYAAAFAWVYALTRIEPGDFGTKRQENAEVILARNHACTPVAAWHIPAIFAGVAGGETGL